MTMEAIWNVHFINFNCYFLIGGLFISYLIYRILQSFFDDNNFIQTKYKVRGHTWRSIECNKSIPYNIYCTICGKLMLPVVGLFCECCGVSACKKCHRILNKKLRCKQITWPAEKPFYHLWVNVGVATRDNVDHHEEGENLKKYFCSWCQRIKLSHENLINDTEECDFNKYKDIIIPPNAVRLEKSKIISIKPPCINNWEPLFIFVNRKSGSNRSDEVISIFRGLLNPLQSVYFLYNCLDNYSSEARVIDISVSGPERVVKWLPDRCRVLVAGGDGTVAWVLNALHTAPHVTASVGILPMGTGNDLSRALGWGAGSSALDAHSIIHSIKYAEVHILDRWRIRIRAARGRLGRLRGERVLYAYNYASVGVDAQVALDFDRARSQFLYRYASRYLNYIAYALLGVGRALDDGGCGGLEKRLRVQLNTGAGGGETLPLPPLQALVVLNIPSWGAGVDLWSMGSEEDVGAQHMDDGKLEVVGISSSFHIARLQCGLAQPYRFAQASHVRIDLEGRCAMQVDGEPWMQGAATILIEPGGRSAVLRPAPRPAPRDTR